MRTIGSFLALSIRATFGAIVVVAVFLIASVFLFLGWLTKESEVDTK